MQDLRGRGDRIAAVEQRPVGKPRGGQEAERRRLVAGDVAIGPGIELGRLDPVVRVERLGRLAEGIAGLQGARLFASAMTGRAENFWSIQPSVGSMLRS